MLKNSKTDFNPGLLAGDYYVSLSGSDGAPGTLAQPFQTIQKAASVMVAGDTAHVRAGVYRETVTPNNSGTQNAPITFMPYSGESVIVSGADVIAANSWILSSGDKYKAVMSWDLGDGSNQVFLDGQMMNEARWPNTTFDVSHPTVAHTSGGSYVDGGTGLSTGTISDVNLPSRPAGYWKGATLNICLGSCWIWQAGRHYTRYFDHCEREFCPSAWQPQGKPPKRKRPEILDRPQRAAQSRTEVAPKRSDIGSATGES